ncbi:MAG: hypothetical protein U1A28_02745 [Patescibacteria group bacterium]|nr:hypothetical protein [Patescibacteria group bacterium]
MVHTIIDQSGCIIAKDLSKDEVWDEVFSQRRENEPYWTFEVMLPYPFAVSLLDDYSAYCHVALSVDSALPIKQWDEKDYRTVDGNYYIHPLGANGVSRATFKLRVHSIESKEVLVEMLGLFEFGLWSTVQHILQNTLRLYTEILRKQKVAAAA